MLALPSIGQQVSEAVVLVDGDTTLTFPDSITAPTPNGYIVRLSVVSNYLNNASRWSIDLTYHRPTGSSETLITNNSLYSEADFRAQLSVVETEFRNILVNETRKIYTDDGRVPTIHLNGSFNSIGGTELDLVFRAGESYYLGGSFYIWSPTEGATIGGLNFLNSGLCIDNAVVDGANSLLGAMAPTGVPKVNIYSNCSFNMNNKSSAMSATDVTIADAMIDLLGGIDLTIANSIGGAGLTTTDPLTSNPTLRIPNLVNGITELGVIESYRSTINIGSANVQNIDCGEVILVAGVGDVNLISGAVQKYSTGSTIAMQGSVAGVKNNISITTSSITSRFGQALSWGSGVAGGYVYIGTSAQIQASTLDTNSATIAIDGNVNLVSEGGFIANAATTGNGGRGATFANFGTGTAKLLGGTLLSYSANDSAVLNNGTGVIHIGPNVTISASSGHAIKNFEPAEFHLDTKASVSGSIYDTDTSNSTFIVHATSTTKHGDLLLSSYKKYYNSTNLTVLNRKFVLDRDDYALHFNTSNFALNALIKINVKTFTNTQTDGEYFTYEPYVVPYSPAVYPNSINSSRGFKGVFEAINPANTDERVKVATGDIIKYNLPHKIDAVLEISKQNIALNGDTGGATSVLSDYVGYYSPGEALVLAAELSRTDTNNVISMVDSEVTFQWKWYKEINGVESIITPKELTGLKNPESHQSPYFPIENVSDSGGYRIEVITSLTRYGEYFEITDSFFVSIVINPSQIGDNKISYSYSDKTTDGWTSGADLLEDRSALITPYTLDFNISSTFNAVGGSQYSYSLKPSASGEYGINHPADYSVVHENNMYSGTALVTLTLSENFVISNSLEHTKQITFIIKPDPIIKIDVVYIDDKAKTNFKREYDAFNKLSLEGIRLVVYYKEHAREVDTKDYKILYERYTQDDRISVDYLSEDGFFAINDGFTNTVKFVYLDQEVVFPNYTTDTLLKVNKLDTGVYMHVPDDSAVTSEALGKYAYNPNAIQGHWEFVPATIVTNAVRYKWSFIPDDDINYVTILNEEIIINPIEAVASGITIESAGLYKYKAFELFSIDSIIVWLHYADEGIAPVDVTSNARVLYYHGSALSSLAVENEFHSMSDALIQNAESDRFLAGDNFVVIMYTPWDNTIMDYGTSFFAAFMLTAPVSKLTADTTLNIPYPFYTSTKLDSLLVQDELELWDVKWIFDAQEVIYPLPGTLNYSYEFIPKDPANYANVTAEAWIAAIEVLVTNIEVVNYDPILSFTAGDVLPDVSALLGRGIIFKLYYNDGTVKEAEETELLFEYAPVYIDGKTENVDFIGKHTYFVVTTVSNVVVRLNLPISVTKQNYAEPYIIYPDDLINDTIIYNDADNMPKVECDSIQDTTPNYDGKGLNVNYYIADPYGSFVYGSGNNRKSYRLISVSNFIAKDVGSYEILFFFVGDADYFNIPAARIVSFDIVEYDPWGSSYDPTTTPPTISSATHEDSVNGDGYWNLAPLPSLYAPRTFAISDQDIIDADDSKYFYWTLDSRPVSKFGLSDDAASPSTVSYTWHWVRSNYKTQSGTIDILVYKNVIKRLYAEFVGEEKSYYAGDTVIKDDLLVYGIYEDGEKYLLSSNSYSIIYNGGYEDGDPLTELNGKGLSGGTAPFDPEDMLRFKGDHKMFSIVADGSLVGLSVDSFSMYVTVAKLKFEDIIFNDMNVLIDNSMDYEIRAVYDARLNATYYSYSAPYENAQPTSNSYQYDGIDSNDPFRGWYDVYEPISEGGVYKILAVFNIIDPSDARDYNDVKPKAIYLSIKRNMSKVVEIDTNYISHTTYYYGDPIPDTILDAVNENASAFIYANDDGSVLVPGKFSLELNYFSIAGDLVTHVANYSWIWIPLDDPIPNDANGYTYLNVYMPVMGEVELIVVGIKDFVVALTNNSASVKAGNSVIDSVESASIIYNDDTERLISDWEANVEIFEIGITQVIFTYSFHPDSHISDLSFVQNYSVSLNANLVDIATNLEKQYTGEDIDIESDYLNLSADFLVEYSADGILFFPLLSDVIDTITVGYQREFSVRISREYYETNLINVRLSIYSAIKLVFDGVNQKSDFLFFNRPDPDFDFEPGVAELENYDFSGWFTTPTGIAGGIRFADANGTLSTSWTDVAELTLYARFVGTLLTIVFDPNGKDIGSEVVSDRRISYNSVFNLIESGWDNADSIRHSYIKGWTTVQNGTEVEYLPGEPYLVLSAMVFYAIWDDATYDVVFNLSGGAFTASSELDTYTGIESGNSTLGLPIDVAKAQYSFAGWTYVDLRGEMHSISYTGLQSQLNTNGKLNFTFYDIGFAKGGNVKINLNAIWVENTYTITFIANGGTGSMPQLIHKPSNINSVFPNNGYSYIGKHFIGWSTTADAQSNIYVGDESLFTDIDNYVNLTPGVYFYSLSLYAVWEINTYPVIFSSNAQDATGNMYPITLTYGTAEHLPLNSFVRNDWVFTGWSTRNTASTMTYADGEEVLNLTLMDGKAIILYAVWTTLSYTLSFNANGGDGSMEKHTFTITDGGKLESNTFTRPGYAFAGWSISSQPSLEIIPDETPHNELTDMFSTQTPMLYALWSALSYNFTFSNGNSNANGNMQPITLLYSDVLIDSTFYLLGNAFNGWTAKYQGNQSTSIFESGETVSSVVSYFGLEFDSSTPEIQLIANWVAVKYFVAYNSNGGNGNMTDQEFTYDISQNLDTNTFTKAGYNFLSWNTQFDGSGVSYNDGATVSNLTSVSQTSVKLYAQWTPVTFTIIFKLDGGNLATDTEITATYGTIITLDNPTKTGYIFQNWVTGDDSSMDADPSYYYSSVNVSYLSEVQDAVVYLWANYISPDTYGVAYYSNGGVGHINSVTGSINAEITLADGSGFSRTGYNFLGWSTDASDSTPDFETYPLNGKFTIIADLVSLYAIWQRITYYATIYQDDSKQAYVNKSMQYAMAYDFTDAIPNRTGYSFTGFVTQDDVAFATSGTYMRSTGVVLIAMWRAHTFTVVFDANTGVGSISPQNITYGSNAVLTLNDGQIYKTGYSFNGWNTTSIGDGINRPNGGSANVTTIDGAVVTLYAKWQAIQYKVVFNANTGTGSMESQTLTYDTLSNLSPNQFEKTGYEFNKWNTYGNGRGISYNDNESVSNLNQTSSDFVLYAIWSAITYSITFESNGADGTMEPQSFAYDTSNTLNSNLFTMTGYTFVAWISDSNETFADESQILNLTSISNDAITFVASWHENSYYISFDANGGTTGSMLDQGPILYTEVVNISLNQFAKTGYGFTGWSLDGATLEYENEASINSGLSSLDGDSVVFYALWTANDYVVNYYANTGIGLIVSQNVKYDQSFNLLALGDVAFSKTGYAFSDWNSLALGDGEKFTAADVVSNLVTSGSFDLYAQWSAVVYKIHFVANGGGLSGTVTQDATFDSTITLKKNEFERPTYYFIGWTEFEDGTGFALTDGATLTVSTASDITLYAKWALITYQVAYDKNVSPGAIVTGDEMPNSEHTFGIGKPLSVASYLREGYSLIGWSENSGDDIDIDYPLHYSKSQLSDENGAIVTLYAVWRINNYTITYIGNGAVTTIATVSNQYGATISTPIIAGTTDNIALRPGFEFRFWTETPNDGLDLNATVYVFGDSMPAHDMLLYAVWEKAEIRYTITLDPSGGNYAGSLAVVLSYDEYITLSANPTKGGYDFVGWFRENASDPYVIDRMPAESFSLTAKWTEQIVTIEFESFGGGNFPNIVGRYNYSTYDADTNVPELNGYTFSGWYSDENYSTKIEGTQTVDYKVTKLFAKWERVKIIIAYDSNGGNEIPESLRAIEVEPGSTFPNPPVVKRSNYTFTGWYLNQELTIPCTYETVPDTVLVLYAGWSAVSTVKQGVPGWAIALIVIVTLLIIAAVVLAILMIKKRENLWKSH
ncbi:MAG: InlB B-repeat-containing protein [Christensenellaceae bacterium]|jgi:uncharacterized repeat protein (TIGR02543 family)|nr:InlB B-repeat-containing protein [Christensenellaceae bacterium]